MMRRSAIIVLLLACTAAAQDVRFDEAITYTTVDGIDLQLNLARPASDGQHPAVLMLHPGGWAAGDRSIFNDACRHFARKGYVAATASYRLAPAHRYPAQIDDVRAAVRFLRDHAEQYSIDPDRIGAMGGSAGAHLAMLLGVTGSDDDPASRVAAVVSIVGPTDLAADDLPAASKHLIAQFLGDDEAAYHDASPINHLDADDPPMLLFFGTADVLIPTTQAYAMSDAMTAAGAPGRIELLIGHNHGFPAPIIQRVLDDSITFFDEHLKAD